MKKIYQTEFYPLGNCFQACIASILEIELDEAPNFMKDGVGKWNENWDEFMKISDYYLLDIELPSNTKDLIYDGIIIANGKSPRGDWNHSIVWQNDRMIHDPYPDGNGIVGKPLCFTLIIPKNIKKWVKL